MNIFVFSTKGGVSKSLIAREIISAPKAKDVVIVEVDELNKTQQTYKDSFKDIITLNKENIRELLVILNEHDKVIVDIGVNDLTEALTTMIEYQIFEDIDKVVIPLTAGRSDTENAFKTYNVISQHSENIMFALGRYNQSERLETQFSIFFDNAKKKLPHLSEDNYVVINESELFTDAQKAKRLVVDMAEQIDYKTDALKAKKAGDNQKFHDLMKLELDKRASQILVKNCIMPAHKKIWDE